MFKQWLMYHFTSILRASIGLKWCLGLGLPLSRGVDFTHKVPRYYAGADQCVCHLKMCLKTGPL